MILRRISTMTMVCSLAVGFGGSAFAADVNFDTTGPDSNNEVKIVNKSDVVMTNTNTVQVTNENVQFATTGDVTAEKNTTVGGLTSGDANNTNNTNTAVAVSNETAPVVPVGGNGEGSVPVTPGSGQGTPATPGQGGEVLGASAAPGMGAGEATLPEVGAKFPVDVSALRAAWQPQTSAPVATLAKGSSWLTSAMLITATLLALLGALGSAWYMRRREERV
jgi:hypothetical protein